MLSLAEDGGSDEESQTALLMAQKLMLKYKISRNELNEGGKQEIINRSLSVYKRIYWWEKVLVRIIADNFRVMFYVQSNRLPHQKSIQRKLVLMGYPEDIELAFDVYQLAAESMKYYASQHIQNIASENKTYLSQLRKSYFRGFLDGLDEKFKKQCDDLVRENAKYALVIKTPASVLDKFNEEVQGAISFKLPALNSKNSAYLEGFDKGKQVSLNRKYLN